MTQDADFVGKELLLHISHLLSNATSLSNCTFVAFAGPRLSQLRSSSEISPLHIVNDSGDEGNPAVVELGWSFDEEYYDSLATFADRETALKQRVKAEEARATLLKQVPSHKPSPFCQ
jgi:hypothetical protein